MPNSLNTITVNGVTYDAETYGKMNMQGASANAASAASITNAAKKNALGKDAFLQLLVTQMQYQDPLDPQDNSQYLSQLAQFSALEQMTNVSEGLSKVSSLVGNIDTSVLVGQLSTMIGKEVQWTKVTNVLDGDGKAVLDAAGRPKTSKEVFEGRIKGVSISDGQPSILAESGGKSYKVRISDLDRIGQGMTAPAP